MFECLDQGWTTNYICYMIECVEYVTFHIHTYVLHS